MADLMLHHYPGACSFVCLVALEQSGLGYELNLVDLSRGEQNGADYRSIAPLGKVPALQSRDGLITENAAILTYIHGLAPAAGILPPGDAPIDLAHKAAGFSFCGGTLHPIVRGLFNPGRMTEGDPEGFRSMSRKLAEKAFAFAEERIGRTGWWLDQSSIIDVYLDWALSVARAACYDLSPYPGLAGLRDRLMEHAVFRRALDINHEARRVLAARSPA